MYIHLFIGKWLGPDPIILKSDQDKIFAVGSCQWPNLSLNFKPLSHFTPDPKPPYSSLMRTPLPSHTLTPLSSHLAHGLPWPTCCCPLPSQRMPPLLKQHVPVACLAPDQTLEHSSAHVLSSCSSSLLHAAPLVAVPGAIVVATLVAVITALVVVRKREPLVVVCKRERAGGRREGKGGKKWNFLPSALIKIWTWSRSDGDPLWFVLCGNFHYYVKEIIDFFFLSV